MEVRRAYLEWRSRALPTGCLFSLRHDHGHRGVRPLEHFRRDWKEAASSEFHLCQERLEAVRTNGMGIYCALKTSLKALYVLRSPGPRSRELGGMASGLVRRIFAWPRF